MHSSEESRDSNAERRDRRWFFGIWGLFFAAILFLFRGVLFPFLVAVLLAYVLAPLVDRLQNVSWRKRSLPRWITVLVVYTLLLGVISAFSAFAAPRLIAELQTLAREIPSALEDLQESWIPALETHLDQALPPSTRPELPPTADDVPDPPSEKAGIRIVALGEAGSEGYRVDLPTTGIEISPQGEGYIVRPTEQEGPGRLDLRATVGEALRALTKNTEELALTIFHALQRLIRKVIKGIFTFFIILMLSAYLLVTSDHILAFLRSLVLRKDRPSYQDLLQRLDRGLGGVVRGQLMIALVNGVLSGIVFAAFDLRYWPLLTLIATLFSIIPIFGSILSSIPAVLIALQQGFGIAIAVLFFIVLIHQLEANIFNPKIMGDAAQVHPVLVVFALLAGEHLFGIAGALLAVPALSIIQSLFLHFREVALGPERLSEPPTAFN